MFCSKCGHEVCEEDGFCQECGNKIEVNTKMTQPSDQEGEETEIEEQESDGSVLETASRILFFLAGLLVLLTKAKIVSASILGPAIILFVAAIICEVVKRITKKNEIRLEGEVEEKESVEMVRLNQTEPHESVSEKDGLGAKGAEEIHLNNRIVRKAVDDLFHYDFKAKNLTVFKSGGVVHGARLSCSEIPIVLFGDNSRVGRITLMGWCGLLYTDEGIYYKLKPEPHDESSALIQLGSGRGGIGIREGFVKYEDIRTIDVVRYYGYAVPVLNGQPIGLLFTNREDADKEIGQILGDFIVRVKNV